MKNDAMEEQRPWDGGISNRQVFLQTARGFFLLLGVAFPLFLLLWFAFGLMPFVGRDLHTGLTGGVTGALAYPIARWLNRA
jgi:hypothetical protein